MNGKTIEWKHLKNLYEKLTSIITQSSGLALVRKLKREHVELTSFSRMRVDLAAQVRVIVDKSYIIYTDNNYYRIHVGAQ